MGFYFGKPPSSFCFMENFVLNAAVEELSQIITRYESLRLGKIYMLGSQSLGLDLRLNDGRTLVLASSPNDSRFYLTSQHPRKLEAQAVNEPPFVQRLRKELSGSFLIKIHKPEGERSISLIFEGYDLSGALRTTQLRLDMIGRSSNLYWLDAKDFILDVLRPVDSIVIGSQHELPAQKDLLNWNETQPEQFALPEQQTEGYLRHRIRGCSSTLACEVWFRSQHIPFGEALCAVRDDLKQPAQAWLYSRYPLESSSLIRLNPKQDLKVSTFPLDHCGGWSARRFESIHQALDEYFTWNDRYAAFVIRKQPWQASLANYVKRLKTAQAKVETAQQTSTDPETWKRYGDLIYANIKTGKRTETSLQVVDYYDPEQPVIEVPIVKDEPLTKAAQTYFQKYQKHQRSQAALAERSHNLAHTLQQAQTALNLLQQAENEAALEHVIPSVERVLPFELRPKTKTTSSKHKAQHSQWTGLRHYRGPEGFDIFVGRTSHDNDRLTFKLARPYDMWLHTADYPGAHVLIRNLNRKPIPHHVIIAAAELAAFFSQASQDDKVNVHYTERKNLSRPRKAPPGLVLLTESKTLLVTPRQILERME